MQEKQVWRSIKFPEKLARAIEALAERERRSFSAQALLIIERELAKREKETAHA